MAPVKLQPGGASGNGPVLDELDEASLVSSVGDAIADAASQRRAIADDPRQAARRAAVDIATAALTANSAETAAHSDDVDLISEAIGRRLGLSEAQLDDVIVAARLHDIGKLGIPSRILNKPAALSPIEWKLIHRHTIIGEQILMAVPELRTAAPLVRHSHERWDGDGYPDGLAGEEIPLGSRIVFCADAFHAIRSTRPYRESRSAAQALAEIQACAGTQFDPAVVAALEAVSGDLRTASNGTRPRSRRAGRLMALMLVVSVGACGSAFARSGLMPGPKPSHALPSEAGSAGSPSSPAPPTGAVFLSSPLFGSPTSSASGAQARHGAIFLPGRRGALAFGASVLSSSAATPLSSAAVTTSTGVPAPGAGQSGHSGATGQAPSTTSPGSSSGSNNGNPTNSTGSNSGSGASNQGQGSGSGSSQGNVNSHGNGNAYGHAKKQGNGSGSTAGSTGGGSDNGNSGSSASGGGKSKKAKGSSSSGSGDSSGVSSASSGNGQSSSGNSGSGSSGGSYKPPQPPKPPKSSASPAPTPPSSSSSGSAASSGSTSGSSGSSSSGGSGNGNGNAGGNGNGHGHGKA